MLRDGRALVAGGYFRVKPDWGSVGSPITLAVARPGSAPPSSPTLDDVAPPFVGAAMATAELFDPTTGTWSKTGSMRWARAGCRAVTLRNGRVLVFGAATGWESITMSERAFDTAELYDPETGRWSPAGRLPDEELADYYRAADLFVMSSRYEACSIAILEAMSSGLAAGSM